MKLGRHYEIRIFTPSGELLTIKPPISVIIDVERSMMAQINTCSITITNLAESSRNAIYKDKYNTLQFWHMFILGGYGETELYEIFRGNIFEAYSYKENTEWLTKIEGTDGAFAIQDKLVAETVAADTPKTDTIKRMISLMPTLLEGVLGSPAQGANKRGQVILGNPYDEIQNLTDGQAFIDSETLHILSANEAIDGESFLLTSDNLFSTPRRRDTYIECETLFSPEVRVGYACTVDSKEKKFNGTYKVLGVKHHLEVSSASGGTASSELSMVTPQGLLTFIKKQATP